MFWRKKKPQPPPQPSRSSKPASNDPKAAPPKLSLLSLESRLMFDAAAAATAAEVNQEQVAQAQAESAVSAEGNGGEPTAAETESQDLLQAIASYSPGESTTEVVFVDPTVPNYQDLLSGLDLNIEVIVLDGGQDGIEQMASALSGRTDIDAIHIISHGTEGQLQLGTGTLTTESMTGQYADELATIQQALSEQADILVYGCDFAEGDVGQDAVALLSQLTGADVAASTDATGAASLGGDWILETQTGVIETQIAVTDAPQMDWVGLLDISTGLLGQWTFDANANDSSGNNYNGTLTNGAAIDTTASTNIVGVGNLSLDGVNDYVDLTPNLANFSTLTQGTISAWVKTTSTSGVIFASNDIADASSGTVLWINSGRLGFAVYENNTALLDVMTTVSINDGNWHLVTVTNGTSGNRLYIDGVQAGVTYNTGSSATDRFFDDVTGKDTLDIGRDQRSGGSTYFNGTIDDVRVYNRVLTGGDIAQLYATSNDAPINAVPGAQSTNEDTNLVFSSGNGNQISITDPDSSGASFEVTVSVTNGSLTLAGTTGLTFTSGDGTTDTTMTFRGTVANINTALNGLTYSPTAEYNGGATLTVATLDSTLVSLDIDANLQARYTFEDTANDVAPGTAQNGTLGGDATYVTDGTRGQVLSLDGVDDYVQIAGRFGDPTNVTLAAWVNLTSADSLGSHVISLGDSVLLTVDEPSVGNGVSGVYYNGSTWVKLATGQFIAGTGWHHIAYIFDDTNNTNTLYIDGAAVATATASTSISYTQGANSFIGKHGNGQTAFDFNGRIDDARVYNRALTASEVASLAADLSLTDTDTVAIAVTAVNDAPTDLSMTPVVNDIATHSITTIASQTGSQSTTATLTSGNSVGVYVSGNDVYAQIYDPQGSPLGSAVRVLGDSDLDIGPVSNPVVAALPTGGFLVVLQAQGYFNSGDWGMAIVGRAYDDGGQLINAVPGHDSTGSMIISNTSAGNTYQSNPTLDVAGDGTITVSWNNTTAGLFQQRQFHILGPTVAENAAAGTVVATLQGVDRDAGETLTYSIVGGDSNFEIVGTQLRVKAGATLDYETATSHTLTLRVTDSGGLTRDEVMTIGVTDANDAPTITNLSGDSLSYSEGAGAVVIEQGANALVADIDSTNFDTGTLTISIPSGGDSTEDMLSIRNQGTGAGQIGVSGSAVTYSGVTIGTFTGGSSGSNLVITLNSNATPTAVTALVKNITYQNTDTNAPTTGARTVRFVLTDGDGGTSADYDTTVTVSGVNDAPVLTDSGLTFTVLEDTGAPVNGTAVGVLLSTFTGNITDPDGAVAKGIAIVGSTETNGTWYYTTDAGATWLTVGVVSDSASLLLADTAGTRLYFSPNSNYNGNVFPGLIVRAWDQSSGAVGTKVDTSVQGGSTAFSVQGDTIDPTVTAVNDPPVFGNLDGTPTFTEGGAAVVLDANVTFTDPELSALNGGAGDYFGSSILLERNGGPDASDVFSATGNLSPLIEGTSLVLSGVTIGYVTTNSGGTLLITFDHNATSARVNEALQSVAYSNSSEAPSSSVVINWVSGDGNDGSQGTGGVLGASGSTTVTITTVNDAPVLADTALTLTVAETAGAPSGAVGSTISTFTGGITDVDSGATKGIAITGTNETNGTWYYTTNGGSTWAAVSAVSNTSALLLADNASTRLYFAPSADYNGTCTGALTLRAWDQTSGTAGTKVSTASNGGTTAFSSATDTIDVSVTAVNDAPTFGVGDGQATTSFGSGWEFGKETILQPDGKILVAGYSDSGGSDDFSLTRYNADGTMDTSFGGGDGIALAGIVGRAETAVLQPDGKIVLSGYTTDGGYQVCLVRFNADGTLDTSFGGGDGVASSGVFGSAKDVALQTDGKFLVAADLSNSNFNLMRFNSDGSLDTSFGGGSGYVSTDLAGGNDRADSLTIQSDGKVILAGFGFNGTSFDFALVRYNTDGSLDTSFNDTGKVLTDFGGNSSDTGNEVRIQTDGKIVVAGWSDTGGTNDFSIIRYNANGTLDTGFGTGGQVTIDLGGSDLAEGLTIQADGKILVTGTAGINGNDFGLVRLNTDGSLDTTFSGDGVATTDYTASSDDRAYSVAVQSDGHIVVSGTSKVGALGEYNYALTRYTSTGALDTTLDPVNTLDGTPNFTEGGSPVVLDGDVQIFDAELSALDNFNGATLTLARNGGANAEDQLVFDGVVVTVSGSAVSVNGVQVGTYTFTGGEMTITLNGNATQTRVNTLMQHILYSNVSDAPPASAQINWTLSDGNSGSQGSGGALTATGSTTVTITPVNDVPTITNLSGDSLAYSEGAGAVVIEQGGNALVADIDSSNFDTGTLTISIPSGGDSAEDVLSIRNQGTGAGQIGVSGSNVTYGGVTIGTFTGGSNGRASLSP
ncbi:MAG: DUF4347 domain-containing protein [Nitrospira sp.]|nr:DUF4347 domain-containing protein [Nitrospira sp.]